MKTILALAPYNIVVSFNEIVINNITYWFTDKELEAAKNRKHEYKKDAEPVPLEPWEFNGD